MRKFSFDVTTTNLVRRVARKFQRTKRGTRRLLAEALEDRRMLAVAWRNPVNSLDVTNDGVVSPLDALHVINELSRGGGHALPDQKPSENSFWDTSGNQYVSPLDALLVVNGLHKTRTPFDLREGQQIATETKLTITVGQPAGTRTYRLQVTPAFDRTDTQSSSSDLFAIYLVDPQHPDQTLLDRGTPGTSLFSLSESGAEFVPGRVRWDGQVVELDLSELTNLDTAELRLQLLSNDNDGGSRVVVKPLTNVVNAAAAAGPRLLEVTTPQVAGSGLDLTGLPVTSDVDVQVENVRVNSTTERYTAELRLQNQGNALGRNVAVVFPNLPSGVVLRNPSGTTTSGKPYVNFAPAIASGGLTKNGSSRSLLVEIDDPSHVPFALSPQILAGPNRPPVLTAIGPLTMRPGERLVTQLNATDIDGDRVTFSVVATQSSLSGLQLPNGSLGSDGQLEFLPEPNQLGTFKFDVIASDGALRAVRSVTLNVVADSNITTRVSGKILDVDKTPLAGMQVEIGAVQGLTASDGSFTLNLGSGIVVSDTLKVRGEKFAGPRVYPFIAEKLPLLLQHDVYQGVNNVMSRPIFLPPLDMANAVTIDPTRDTLVTTAALPGMALNVAAGTLMNQQGTPFTGRLSITKVPVELTPAALPGNLFPDLVVTIQPGEMVFARPAPLTFPNTAGWAPGMLMDLWSINPVTGQFDDVGDMRVSADGKTIETISGGVRNSSWHFSAPPPPPPPPPPPDDDCDECKKGDPGTSTIESQSGALIETHDLVTYQSLGATRGLTLTYDSLRADPRPIVHASFENVDPTALAGSQANQLRLVASLRMQQGNVAVTVPGFVGSQFGLSGGENFWKLPADAGPVDAALQADLRSQPTGKYDYVLSSSIRLFSVVQNRFVGTAGQTTSHVLSVNSIDSPFGAGWGLDGLQQLVENRDDTVMLVDGDGSESLYQPTVETVRDFLLPDSSTDSILRYDGLTGALKGTFVAGGAGGLDAPHNPTFGPDGNLYVFSNANNGAPNAKILRFNGQTGAFIDVFVNTGSGGFAGSAQMAFGPDGNLYLGQGTVVLRFDGVTGAPLGLAASGNGLMRACGIAFGPDGNLYVGDSKPFQSSTNYDRVLRFDTAGNFIDVFVPSGNLNNTCPIDFGSDGNLYIADQGPRDIRRFDGATGTFMGVFAADARLGTPFRATSGIDGNLYVGVSVPGTPGAMARVDGTTGKFIDRLVGNNTGFGTFLPGPAVLPVRNVQDLLIQDTNNDTVLRYDGITGERIGQFVGRGAGGLDAPHNATFGVDGNMYVFSDAPGAQKILRFNGKTGSFMDVYVDTGEGGFAGGSEMNFGPDGTLYVASGGALGVLRYDTSGNFIGAIAGPADGVQQACGIEFGPNGNLYVYDTFDEELRRFNPQTGAFVDRLIAPSANLVNACDFDIGPSGDIFITDATLGGVRRFDGTTGAFLGVFATTSSTGASGVTFGPDGNLYVNVNGNTDRFNGQTGAFINRFVAGNGGFVNFFPARKPLGATTYTAPHGDFSSLQKFDDGTFRRTMTDQTVEDYNAAGRITRMTDRNGNVTTWEYDAAGKLLRMVDPVGLATTLGYTGGKVTSITDPAGRVTQFAFDTAGNLLRITDPDGSQRTFDYDADHRMTGELDQRGHHEQAIYDFAGRVDSVIRKNGAVIDVSPTQVRGLNLPGTTADPFAAPLVGGDLTGQATYVDANGNVTVTTLDRGGQETSSIDAVGAMPTTEYDPITNLPTKVTDARGNVTNYTYDTRGNLLSKTDSINPANPTLLAYDPTFNQLTSIIDEQGHQTLVDIDPANGNARSIQRVIGTVGGSDDLVTTMTYTASGLVDRLTDPLGRVTDFDYNPSGRLTRLRSAVGTAAESLTQFEYDSAGNTTAIVDANGNRSTYQYDALNRVKRITEADPDGAGPLVSPVTLMSYDAAGNRTSMTDARGNVTQYEYDLLNRPSRIIDALSHITNLNHDNVDNLTSSSDPLTHATLLVYDTRNRPIGSIDPDGGRTRFAYDSDDNLISVTDPAGNTTRFAYDARSRVVNMTDQLGHATIYGYDLSDNLVAMTDRLGRVTEFAYDDVDRLVKETWVGGGNTIQYSYDKSSNLVSAADNFSSLAFSYDTRDRVTTVDNLSTPNVPRVVLNYAYDAVGNMLSVADTIAGAAGGLNSYQYDALNRLARLTQTGTNVASKRVDFGYNPLGQFNSIARFADLAGSQQVATSNYSYDALNRLTSLNHKHSATTLDFVNLAYDAASRITQIANIDGTTDYNYDPRDELVGAAHSDPANPDETYAYDSNGNRTTATTRGAAAAYQTGQNNRLLTNGTFNYTYDKEGNLILRTEIATGSTRAFTWDFRNRLSSVIDENSLGAETQRVEFSYDTFNRRISKNVVTAGGTVLTHFVYDRSNVLLDFSDTDGAVGPVSPALVERYLHGPAVDQILAQDDGVGGVLWMLADQIGSITDLVDSAGAIVNHIKYDSYGNIISQSNFAKTTRYRYTGREFDAETGLNYYRARYLDPQIGRFLSEDPILFDGREFNLYAYVHNNPISRIDPSGMFDVGPISIDPKKNPPVTVDVIDLLAPEHLKRHRDNITKRWELLAKYDALSAWLESLKKDQDKTKKCPPKNPIEEQRRKLRDELIKQLTKQLTDLRNQINNLVSEIQDYANQHPGAEGPGPNPYIKSPKSGGPVKRPSSYF